MWAFLPDLLAALAVLIIGLIVAWLLSALVRAVLNRTTLDNKIAERLSQDPGGKPLKVESIVSRVVFWVVMIITVVAFFNVLNLDMVAGPLGGFLEELFAFLPNLLSALLLLALAWLMARLGWSASRYGVLPRQRTSISGWVLTSTAMADPYH